MITIMIVIMIITTINHNNHNNWNPYYIHKIIIPSSPLHTTNCSPQLPCLEWRHCDLLANQRPQSLKENPQGRVFSPCGGVLFFVPNFCWCPKKLMRFFLQEKNVGSWGRWGSQLQTLFLLKLPLEFPGVMYKSPRFLGVKTNHWVV